MQKYTKKFKLASVWTNCILISDKLHPQKTRCILIFTLAAMILYFLSFILDTIIVEFPVTGYKDTIYPFLLHQ